MSCYIFDLDLTIADSRHREHLIGLGWEAYNRECMSDIPMIHTIIILKALHAYGCKIILVTARGEDNRFLTERWLAQHSIPFDELHMRQRGDERSPSEFKLDVFNEIAKTTHITAAFDDNVGVIETLEQNGYKMIQIPWWDA